MTEDARSLPSDTQPAAGSELPEGALPGVQRSWVAAASRERLCFEGVRPARAPLVITPVVFVLSIVPWLSPSPLTAARVFTALALLTAAVTLLLVSLPRRRRIELSPRDAQLRLGQHTHALGSSPRWHLDVFADANEPHGFRYAARLAASPAQGWHLIQDSEPARVLLGLRRALRAWPLPVTSGWSLPQPARPWEFSASGRSNAEDADNGCPPSEAAPVTQSPQPLIVRAPRLGVRSGLAATLLLITAIVAAELIYLVYSSSRGLSEVHPLSLVLPSALVLILAGVTLCVASRTSYIVVSRHVSVLTSTWLSTRCRGRVATASVRGVHIVGLQGAALCHLLVDTNDGPLSMVVPSRVAAELAQSLRQAIAQKRGSVALPRAALELGAS